MPGKKKVTGKKTDAGRKIGKRRSIEKIIKKNRMISDWLREGGTRGGRLLLILTDKPLGTGRKKSKGPADAVIEVGADTLKHILEIEKENRQLRSLSLTDELTGLYNKRFFKIQLGVEMARSRRTGQSFCLAILDFDNFKVINDNLGHSEGDRFLKEVGLLMRDRLRPTDFLCRLGGDEFGILMPATGLVDAIGIARRLQQFITDIHWKKYLITASIGMVEFDPASKAELDDIFNLADTELYRAKKDGKNKIAYRGTIERRVAPAEPVSLQERDLLLKTRGEIPPK
jgi:diguanylate cyclase (GGDEF)-like protein